MPHPSKPPHKHAFVQYSSRAQAEGAKFGLRKKLNHLQFVQKVGWGRPPKLVKESFKFDSGIGEILKSDAPHIVYNPPKPQLVSHPPPNYGAMYAPNHNMSAHNTAASVGHVNGGGAFINQERAQMIAGSHPQYAPYNPMQPTLQYSQYPYNPQGQHAQPTQPASQYPQQYR